MVLVKLLYYDVQEMLFLKKQFRVWKKSSSERDKVNSNETVIHVRDVRKKVEGRVST